MSKSLFIGDKIRDRQILLDALSRNMSWIMNSFSNNNNFGSSKYRTLWGGWAKDYPETTGYLLPTLLKSNQLLNKSELITLAHKQVEYFKKLQLTNGGFSISKGSNSSFVFDSAQIMLGLISIYKDQNDIAVLSMIDKCCKWLIGLINNQGEFISSNFKKNYNPSYYARITWAISYAEDLLNTKSEKTRLQYQKMTSLLNENGTFKDCSFDGASYAFTHNLIYAYRGLWESALLTNDDRLLIRLENHVTTLARKIINQRKFNGEYNEDWKFSKSFICTTGNAQLVVLLLSIYERNTNKVLLETCDVLMKPLLIQQARFSIFNSGALPGSIPIWGKYQRFRYPNWTQKFFADALIKLLTLNS